MILCEDDCWLLLALLGCSTLFSAAGAGILCVKGFLGGSATMASQICQAAIAPTCIRWVRRTT
jgi:hypothetical protein